jgi:hypothetical protein
MPQDVNANLSHQIKKNTKKSLHKKCWWWTNRLGAKGASGRVRGLKNKRFV